MRLANVTMLDLLKLAAQARPDEIEQYEALLGEKWNVDAVANDHFNRRGIKFALLDDAGEVVVAGGYDPIIEGVWQSWMLGTMSSWEKHWRGITKATRYVMQDLFDDGARRLQTSALVSRHEACHWYIKGLKMQPEGVMRKFGVNGEDVAMFARLRED